jgi:hypothetical protein
MNRLINTTLLLNPLNWVIVPVIVLLFGVALNLVMNPPGVFAGNATGNQPS